MSRPGLALFGRWHDVARLLEHEAAVSLDDRERDALLKAATILRARGDVEARIEAEDKARRMGPRRRGGST